MTGRKNAARNRGKAVNLIEQEVVNEQTSQADSLSRGQRAAAEQHRNIASLRMGQQLPRGRCAGCGCKQESEEYTHARRTLRGQDAPRNGPASARH